MVLWGCAFVGFLRGLEGALGGLHLASASLHGGGGGGGFGISRFEGLYLGDQMTLISSNPVPLIIEIPIGYMNLKPFLYGT